MIDAYHPGNKTSVVWADLAGQTYTATVILATGPVAELPAAISGSGT